MTFSREIILNADSMDAYVSLFGMNDQNIALIEQECSVSVALRGSRLTIQGEENRLDLAEKVIRTLFSMIQHHEYVDRVRIRYVIAMIREGKKEQIEETFKNVIAVTHRGKQITCKTIGQQQYVNAIRQNLWRIEDLEKATVQETGEVTLTNSLAFPFNNSQATVALANVRDNLNYVVEVISVTPTGGPAGEIEFTDRQVNGFKVAFTGSASKVVVKYAVIGGYN